MISFVCFLSGILVILVEGTWGSRIWHVASNGSDSESCGLQEQPCLSLSHTVNQTLDGDTIKLIPSDQHDYGYDWCLSVIVDKSLTFIGDGENIIIGCSRKPVIRDHTNGSNIKIQPSAEIEVIFINIEFRNMYIFISRGHLTLSSCQLINAAVRSSDGCHTVSINIQNSTFSLLEPPPSDDLTRYDSSFFCLHITAKITSTTFSDMNMNFDGKFSCHVSIHNCTFRKLLEAETGMGGVNISVAQENGSVIVTDTLFEKFIHYNPVLSSINIESSVLRIESRRSIEHTHISATIDISDSVFKNNERAVSISRNFKNISISRCKFLQNYVMHAAAAVRIAIGRNNTVYFNDVTFDENSAGLNRHASVPGKFEYDGFQIHIREQKVNGIISLVGKGGAVRVHRGHIKFRNCIFRNNTASLLGGALFIAKNGTVELNNCSFMNSDVGKHSMQGDMMYSSGEVTIINTKFLTKTSKDHISVLRHSGDPWSMNVKSLWFECPMGYRLVMVNTTSHRVEATVGLIRSNKLDQLYYYCQTCGNNQYSIDQGLVNFTVTTNVDHFYTLMINGQQPFDSHPIDYKFGNITCRECPYGGDCEGDIRAVANFWGYTTSRGISFQHCPPDYCCTSTHCSSVDDCASYRHGRLCGRCRNGYSESLFSSSCVPNSGCASHWIWAALSIMGIIYVTFLITQKEIRDFVAASSWDFMCCKKPQKENTNENDVDLECMEQLSPDGNGLTKSDNDQDLETVNKAKTNKTITKESIVTEKSAGTLIILFYYFQDSLLLHMDTIYTRTVSKFVKRLKNFLVGLFWFRLDFFQFVEGVCLFPDMQPVEKLLFKALFVPYVLTLLGVIFVLHGTFRRICMSYVKHRGKIPRNNADVATSKTTSSFSCRLASGFVLAMLFTYQKMATTTFALLNCVPVGNISVLHIDGTRECFEWWQYVVIIYAATCVGPFCLILMLGPPLLKNKTINVFQFCVGTIVPLPSLIYWLYCYNQRSTHITRENNANGGQVMDHQQNTNSAPPALTPEAITIIEILQDPFKDTTSKRLIGQISWAGVLLGRRLILFVCYTFITDVLVRLLCMICVCFIILMQHMYVRPYKIRKANLAGAFSASALLVVGTINLMRACFEAAEYIPQGPYKILMEVCEDIENTLVLWLPLAGVSIILFSLLIRLFIAICRRCLSKD